MRASKHHIGVMAGILLAVATGAVFGCQQSKAQDLLARGERLTLDAQWVAAIPPLRAHLLEHPEDAGGHFYLGRCYMIPETRQFRPALAVGEFQTALGLFERNGRHSPIERFADDYFEYICNLEIVKVRLLQIELKRTLGSRPRDFQRFVEEARQHLEAAARLQPDAEEILVFKKELEFN